MSKRFLVTTFIFMFVMLFGSSQGQTATLLYDDFYDGSYLDGTPVQWEIDWTHPNDPSGVRRDFDPPEVICEGSDCYLNGHTTFDPGVTKNATLLFTANPTTVGGWQFDSRLKSTEDDQWNFFLISAIRFPSLGGLGYAVSHTQSGEVSLTLRRHPISTTLISASGFGGKDDIWHTIKATRNAAGEWKLFVDGALVGTTVDNTLTTLPYFFIGRYGSYDNVIVTDDPTTLLDQCLLEASQCQEDLAEAQQQIETLTEDLNTVRAQLGVGQESPISAAILAIQQLQSQVAAATMTIEGLEHHLQEIFRDPEFQVPGATLEEKLQNLLEAIRLLNRGRKLGLYVNLIDLGG
ncbi:MAG: hypothetical protein HY731_02645 [Candidatus Tectomicrobia bacterium]|nr:hypothetical protein [Candidatus Tectomicrobia bacterium]